MAECIPEINVNHSSFSESTTKEKKNSPNLVSALVEHNEVLDAKLSQYEETEAEQQAKTDLLKSQLEELQNRLQELDSEVEELKANNASPNGDDATTQQIQELLATYEKLKLNEKKFKQSCHEELEKLQLLAAQSEDSDSSQDEIEAQLERAKNRVEAGRAELAAISRKVATLKRQIEQVPNRTELREYRLRFAELYNQVSATHRQTKQFFSLYNSLEDTKRYLEKELSLLNSIVDSYQQACQTASGREEFLRQLSTLYDGMKETCSKVDRRFQSEKIVVEKLQQELQRLVEQKVAYEKCLKELESECKVNDQLLSLCRKMESKKL